MTDSDSHTPISTATSTAISTATSTAGAARPKGLRRAELALIGVPALLFAALFVLPTPEAAPTGATTTPDRITDPTPEPEETLLADFDDGLQSRFGHGWVPTTDTRMGGKSVVELAAENGALEIVGELKPGAMFPWAGALVFPGSGPMVPVDASARGELRFRARGDGRAYSVMIFSGEMQGVPPTLTFSSTEAWSTVTLPLADFAGADPSRLRGIAFTATGRPGTFRFEIDDVELR